jgi:hypothetical protein
MFPIREGFAFFTNWFFPTELESFFNDSFYEYCTISLLLLLLLLLLFSLALRLSAGYGLLVHEVS